MQCKHPEVVEHKRDGGSLCIVGVRMFEDLLNDLLDGLRLVFGVNEVIKFGRFED